MLSKPRNMCGCTASTNQPRSTNSKNGTSKNVNHDVCVFGEAALRSLLAYELTPLEVAVVKSQINLQNSRCNAYEKQIEAIHVRLGLEIRAEDHVEAP